MLRTNKERSNLLVQSFIISASCISQHDYIVICKVHNTGVHLFQHLISTLNRKIQVNNIIPYPEYAFSLYMASVKKCGCMHMNPVAWLTSPNNTALNLCLSIFICRFLVHRQVSPLNSLLLYIQPKTTWSLPHSFNNGGYFHHSKKTQNHKAYRQSTRWLYNTLLHILTLYPRSMFISFSM